MNTKATITKERRAARFSRTTTVAVIAIVLFVSLVLIKPSAPKSIVLLTGPEGSSYHEMGMRLAASIEEMGLETEVRTSTGGIENAEKVAAGTENTIAFAPSTVEEALGPEVDAGKLVSLGSIAFEPFWLFSRSEYDVNSIADLVGWRVATGDDSRPPPPRSPAVKASHFHSTARQPDTTTTESPGSQNSSPTRSPAGSITSALSFCRF